MKKVLLTAVALFVVAGMVAPAAQAQVTCFKWVSFCDGVQVDALVPGGMVTQIQGTWYHWDCANNMPGMQGKIAPGNFESSCDGSIGNAFIACRVANGCNVSGSDWGFVIDNASDGTLDMINGAYPGSCWINELAYNRLAGACTGLPELDKIGYPNVSSVE